MTSPARHLHHPIRVAAFLVLGVAAGLGVFTFVYAKGYSYLGRDSAACANCHAMNEQYAGWVQGSHRRAAECGDCHMPFAPIGKYAVKAYDGFWHSYYFTANTYPDNIRITALGRRVAEGQCRACHAPIIVNMAAHGGREGTESCIRCHATVGHQ